MKRFLQHIAFRLAKNPTSLIIFLCVAISFTVLIRYRWRENNWKGVVHSDGAGYYAYLPAIFIHHDLQYRFYPELKDKYGFGDLSENFCHTHNGRLFNRYFCGTAIAEAPFFFVAWLIAVITGQEADGHSFIFHAAINVAALFYAMAGLYLLSLYLRKHVKPVVAAASCGMIYLGTNLFNYTINEPAYSHAYSFSFICLFIYLADRSIRTRSRKSYLLLAFNAAMIVLIRPSNGMVIFALPFIAGSWSSFTEWMRSAIHPKILLPVIICGAAPLSIQLLLYYFQCGAWLTDGYAQERFYFLDPHILNALFSYRAGVFPWSPITMLALPGLYYLWKKNAFASVAWIAFMFINLWVISSWWAWHYAGTFGMRPVVDYMSFFLIATAYFLEHATSRSGQIITYSLAAALTTTGHIFNYQVTRHILPHDLMTSEKYWYIFMKTKPEYSYDLDHPYTPRFPDHIDDILVRHYAFSPPEGFELPEVYDGFYACDTLSYKSTGSATLVKLAMGKLAGSKKYHLELKMLAHYPSLYQSGEVIVQFRRGDEVLQTHGQRIIVPHYLPSQWNDFRMVIQTFGDLSKATDLEVKFQNGDRYNILLQQLEISLASFGN
jgi:hypothetical protein